MEEKSPATAAGERRPLPGEALMERWQQGAAGGAACADGAAALYTPVGTSETAGRAVWTGGGGGGWVGQ